MKTAVIGAGVSGMSLARMLSGRHEVTVFEKEARPGGLSAANASAMSSSIPWAATSSTPPRPDVLDWFWALSDRERDFRRAVRHAVVSLESGNLVDYPVENHLYQMPASMRNAVIGELMNIQRTSCGTPANFDEFLRGRFGGTLYENYFSPYNNKIWRSPLTDVPLDWLAGKLPMPSVREIMEANIGREDETAMVHSSFWYPLNAGSQFLADGLTRGLNIRFNHAVGRLERRGGSWRVDGERFDLVFYTGNARALPGLVGGELSLAELVPAVARLEFHGTASVLCEVDSSPYSWVYMPSRLHESHRIICTGNFSPGNSGSVRRSTAVIEFSREMSRDEIDSQLALIPFHPRFLACHWEPCSYPVRTGSTQEVIGALKAALHPHGLYLSGRFAEWEHYNMDAAVGAALDLTRTLRDQHLA